MTLFAKDVVSELVGGWDLVVRVQLFDYLLASVDDVGDICNNLGVLEVGNVKA